MGVSRHLVGIVSAGVLAGMVSGCAAEGPNLPEEIEIADAPLTLPPEPAGATCKLITRGGEGDIADSDISAQYPDYPTGGYYYSWTGPSPMEHRSLFKADLSPIPAGAQVVLAHFFAYTAWNMANGTVRVHAINHAWNESNVTWNNFGGTTGFSAGVLGSFNGSWSGYPDGWRSVDVTSLVASWVNGSAQNYGIGLEEDLVSLHMWVNGESSGANRPALYVCYVDSGVGDECASEGTTCSSNADCCGELPCVSGICGGPGVEACSTTTCGPNQPSCCNGYTCSDGQCVAACVTEGGACGSDGQCCNGLSCDASGHCAFESVCQEEGNSCGSEASCCGDLVCNDSNTCVTCTAGPEVGDFACSADKPCCEGACMFDFCMTGMVCQPQPGGACNDADGMPCCYWMMCNSVTGTCELPN